MYVFLYMSKELIHISLHSDLKSDVKEKCEKKDITVTSYITKLIENDLKKMDSLIDGTINVDDLNNIQSDLREDLKTAMNAVIKLKETIQVVEKIDIISHLK